MEYVSLALWCSAWEAHRIDTQGITSLNSSEPCLVQLTAQWVGAKHTPMLHLILSQSNWKTPFLSDLWYLLRIQGIKFDHFGLPVLKLDFSLIFPGFFCSYHPFPHSFIHSFLIHWCDLYNLLCTILVTTIYPGEFRSSRCSVRGVMILDCCAIPLIKIMTVPSISHNNLIWFRFLQS
jgi:hypothetical protein